MNITADDLVHFAAAALLRALVAMFAFMIGNAFYAPETTLAQNAYPIEIPEPSTASAEVVEEEVDLPDPIAPLLASADIEAGMTVARACGACHSFDEGGAQKVGPNLWIIVGAAQAGYADFG